jgi:hypothetical protein
LIGIVDPVASVPFANIAHHRDVLVKVVPEHRRLRDLRRGAGADETNDPEVKRARWRVMESTGYR